MSYADLDALTRANVKDDSGKLTETDYQNGISAAIKRYSKARPQELCEDIAGTGSYDLDLPDGWQLGFSGIISIEYPIGDIPESYLSTSDYRLYRSPAGRVIRLAQTKLALTDTVRVTYSASHDDSTIPDSDLEPVANLAAAYCLLRLAAVYGNASDSTIQADSVNRQSKIDEYRRLAEKFEGLFNKALGLKDNDTVAAASVTAAPPVRDAFPLGRYR